MVVDDHPVANFQRFNSPPGCSHKPGGFVTQGERRAWGEIPFHRIGDTYTGSFSLNQDFTWAGLREGMLFDAHVVVVVIDGYFHVGFVFVMGGPGRSACKLAWGLPTYRHGRTSFSKARVYMFFSGQWDQRRASNAGSRGIAAQGRAKALKGLRRAWSLPWKRLRSEQPGRPARRGPRPSKRTARRERLAPVSRSGR